MKPNLEFFIGKGGVGKSTTSALTAIYLSQNSKHILLVSYKNMDIIIFDMAPTALTLRFFLLPFITLIWLGELLKLRNKIYTKREIISKIKVAGKEIEQDKVKVKLTNLIHNYEYLRDLFLSSEAKINLVMNDDRLSVSEALRIETKLSEIGIQIDKVIINKAQQTTISEAVNIQFRHQKKALFPFSTINLLGYEALRDYVNRNREISFREE